ncbi:xanthine dehydrogenase family protein molybdopterin-binding subunit [Xanthocytophaga agilis]|uniref:Xanthine dehydrogenase family protein molybdopterin-binding subunit n=1 Tax=Xanthocytophaga agilis TaxID=3048010 RepID=A0AAE3UCH8_9BACT|nr:xanthine dehydrogenase family protein molybdopterin-binding subunit [Xanthocytophaga agilis]MDJ1500893.1 xanthine dehydrogenase family protein molybdopterin-binding subunit [Xanthocytophaga agilis]
MSTQPLIGQSVSRLEGHLKVTGKAKYAGDYTTSGLLYGYIVNSTITKGKITAIHTEEAKALTGVIEVFSHENKPSLAWLDLKYADMDAPPGTVFKPLHDGDILCNGQPIALVVAETFELARYAASLVRVEYEEEHFETNLKNNLDKARAPKIGLATLLKPLPPKPVGDFEKAFNQSYAQVEAEYSHGTEHHNPLELFATTTIYEKDGKLTIYDKTQGTVNCQVYVANVFGLSFKDVRVISPYVGGAFGSGLRPQYQLFFSVLAALQLKRSVKVMLDRHQMFTFGHRPPTIQHTRFGADKDGKVNALNHSAFAETSQFEDYTEVVVNWSHMLYPAENTLMEYKLVPLDVYSPLDMRAPGGSTGIHAIESSMDELAYKLNIDPLELRLINYADRDVSVDRPYSSKELKECYLQGAEKFGWANRNPQPRSMKRGNKLVGYGMATGIWEANRLPARAEVAFTKQGKLQVKSAVTDIGTGTFTVISQIAADELGLLLGDVNFSYGDSKMPFAPIQGGSFTIASVGTAVREACKALRKKLLKKAQKMEGSAFADASIDDVVFREGAMYRKDDPSIFVKLTTVIDANKGRPVKTTNFAVPNVFKLKKYSRATHSAAFVEVEVDEELGVVNVTRALTVVAAGRIINPKTARSQVLGGMVWSISKALREETISDYNLGKYMNPNLAEYHIPVHADIHELDVMFVEEKEEILNDLGIKGVGEIGLVAMPPAIANAIYHATGKRINQFPIHLEALL